MPIQVSISDLLGTSALLARSGARYVAESGERELDPDTRDVRMRMAMAELTQALAEVTVSRFIAGRPDAPSLETREFAFTATCEDLVFAISAQLEDYL